MFERFLIGYLILWLIDKIWLIVKNLVNQDFK